MINVLEYATTLTAKLKSIIGIFLFTYISINNIELPTAGMFAIYSGIKTFWFADERPGILCRLRKHGIFCKIRTE